MIEIVTIKVRDHSGQHDWHELRLCGERISEHLALTPCTIYRNGESALRGDWQITHLPTGLAVPQTDRSDVDEVESIGRVLADLPLDWSTTDLNGWRDNRDASKAVIKAIEQHNASWGEDE